MKNSNERSRPLTGSSFLKMNKRHEQVKKKAAKVAPSADPSGVAPAKMTPRPWAKRSVVIKGTPVICQPLRKTLPLIISLASRSKPAESELKMLFANIPRSNIKYATRMTAATPGIAYFLFFIN